MSNIFLSNAKRTRGLNASAARSMGNLIETPPGCLNTVGRLLLLGHRDKECVLSRLPKDVLRLVYEWIKAELERHILVDFPLKYERPRVFIYHSNENGEGEGQAKNDLQALARSSFLVLDEVVFPKPNKRYCNMLPFKPADLKTIPEEFESYVPMIQSVLVHCDKQFNEDTVFYLTVHESEIEPGTSQRRPGLHIESPGKLTPVGATVNIGMNENYTANWGKGWAFAIGASWVAPFGGIYMVSNVADSCRVWNCSILEPHNIVGRNGNCESLRSVLDRKARSETMPPNRLCWITDCTPHESLPVASKTSRQYVRVVTGDVSAWFSKHSTANPECPLPKNLRVIDESKFEDWEEETFASEWKSNVKKDETKKDDGKKDQKKEESCALN